MCVVVVCHVSSIICTIWFVYKENLPVPQDENIPVCAPYLSLYEVGRSLWWAGEGQLLPRDHHHLGARLVDMGGCHRARGTAGRDTSRPTARRQAGPVGIVGLHSRQVSKPRRETKCGRWERAEGERWGWTEIDDGTNVDDRGKEKRKGKIWEEELDGNGGERHRQMTDLLVTFLKLLT